MRLPIIPNPPSPKKKPPSPSLLTQDARCASSYPSYGARNGRPAATVPLSPNRILISSTETGNHAAPARPPGGWAGTEKTRAPRKGVRSQAKPGTATSSLRGMRRGSVPGHVHVPLPPPARSWVGLACMLAATPPPTRRRAVARPFQGRVSRQRLKAPGLNARRVRTDPSICSAPLRPKV